MLFVDRTICSGHSLMLPSAVFTHLKAGVRTAGRLIRPPRTHNPNIPARPRAQRPPTGPQAAAGASAARDRHPRACLQLPRLWRHDLQPPRPGRARGAGVRPVQLQSIGHSGRSSAAVAARRYCKRHAVAADRARAARSGSDPHVRCLEILRPYAVASPMRHLRPRRRRTRARDSGRLGWKGRVMLAPLPMRSAGMSAARRRPGGGRARRRRRRRWRGRSRPASSAAFGSCLSLASGCDWYLPGSTRGFEVRRRRTTTTIWKNSMVKPSERCGWAGTICAAGWPRPSLLRLLSPCACRASR